MRRWLQGSLSGLKQHVSAAIVLESSSLANEALVFKAVHTCLSPCFMFEYQWLLHTCKHKVGSSRCQSNHSQHTLDFAILFLKLCLPHALHGAGHQQGPCSLPDYGGMAASGPRRGRVRHGAAVPEAEAAVQCSAGCLSGLQLPDV